MLRLFDIDWIVPTKRIIYGMPLMALNTWREREREMSRRGRGKDKEGRG